MKRSYMPRSKKPMNRIGPQGRKNQAANRDLKKEFEESGRPQYCEARFEHECTRDQFTGWAHRSKRSAGRRPDLRVAAFLCNNAHAIIEVMDPEEMAAIVDGIVEARETEP